MIIVDSNTWIFAENENAEEHQLATKKIKEVFETGSFGINVVIASEVFHILGRLTNVETASARVTNIIEHPLAQWLEFSNDTVIKAISLSKKEQVRINDALIAQQALELRARILTDNVKDFKKVRSLDIIPLR